MNFKEHIIFAGLGRLNVGIRPRNSRSTEEDWAHETPESRPEDRILVVSFSPSGIVPEIGFSTTSSPFTNHPAIRHCI
jgi:hypothetical protein